VDARHRAARLEDWYTTRLGALLRRRGWLPVVVGYTGYGAAATADGDGWVRVLARVVRARPLREGEPEDAHPEEGEALGAAAVKALRGWRSFVTAPVPNADVVVVVGSRRHTVTSDRSGYLDAVLASDLPAGTQEVSLDIIGQGESAEPTRCPVVVIGAQTERGIVSDIDDTVMVTSLPRPLIAAWNTFVLHPQARRPVEGMAELLTQAARRRPGTPVLYLSTGAWNVAPSLTRFIARHGFPPGPLLLTDWGPTNTGWFRSGREHKRAALRRLQAEFPHVTWLLVGDDGQHDPAIYREFAADASGHVAAIAIRQLTPTEQVLSHGRPVPVSTRPPAARAPVVQGPDGLVLLRQLRGADLL
jgi:phosphatidate phosphatase APP1